MPQQPLCGPAMCAQAHTRLMRLLDAEAISTQLPSLPPSMIRLLYLLLVTFLLSVVDSNVQRCLIPITYVQHGPPGSRLIGCAPYAAKSPGNGAVEAQVLPALQFGSR